MSWSYPSSKIRAPAIHGTLICFGQRSVGLSPAGCQIHGHVVTRRLMGLCCPNAHCSQARQAKYDHTRTELCQLRLGERGTLCHRRFDCPATERHRRQFVSSALAAAAKITKSLSKNHHHDLFMNVVYDIYSMSDRLIAIHSIIHE